MHADSRTVLASSATGDALILIDTLLLSCWREIEPRPNERAALVRSIRWAATVRQQPRHTASMERFVAPIIFGAPPKETRSGDSANNSRWSSIRDSHRR